MTAPGKRVLYILPEQFGHCAGYLYYCKYLLRAGYAVTVLHFDQGRTPCGLDGLEQVAIKAGPTGNPVARLFRPLLLRLRLAKAALGLKKSHDVIIIKYMPGAALLGLLCGMRRCFLDIRSVTIAPSAFRRKSHDALMRLEAKFFPKVFVLTDVLAEQLRISPRKAILLPLGADDMSPGAKDYAGRFSLLYIGTFAQRNIHLAVRGFAAFYRRYGGAVPASFDLIGDGPTAEMDKIRAEIESNGLQGVVFLRGRLAHHEARKYFERCGYGVSFVPIVPFFDRQPPTKTYEYVLSGLYVLGTDTAANRELINPANGILFQDTAEAFAAALEKTFLRRHEICEGDVRGSLAQYSWKLIVDKIIDNLLI